MRAVATSLTYGLTHIECWHTCACEGVALEGVYDTVVQRGGWSCSTVIKVLRAAEVTRLVHTVAPMSTQ
jgi:hypothetical protein